MQFLTNDDIKELNTRLIGEKEEQHKIMRRAIKEHIAYISRQINSIPRFPLEISSMELDTTPYRFNAAEFNDIREYFKNFTIGIRTESVPDMPCYYHVLTISPIYPIKGRE